MPKLQKNDILGLVLAGGLARRMGGGDKGFRKLHAFSPLAGQSILDLLLERARPQFGEIILSANGDPARFSAFNCPVVPDNLPDNPGPLAGVLAGLQWARQNRPAVRALVTLPCDGPFVPLDLVERLLEAVNNSGKPLAVVSSRGRANPVVGLWPVDLADNLRQALTLEGLRKVDRWTAKHGVVEVPFADVAVDGQSMDPFFNANKPEDLQLKAQ